MLTCFMPNHWLLLFIFENSSQSRNGPFVLHLSQAVSQLMLQQGWFISEGFADPFYSFSTWHTQMTPWISSPKNHYRHSVTANILQQYATAVLWFQFTLKKDLSEKKKKLNVLSFKQYSVAFCDWANQTTRKRLEAASLRTRRYCKV